MAVYRSVQTTFWTDTKITDGFTPEEKYLYLYLMTNPHTTLSGCYEVSLRQIAFDTGLSTEKVKKGIESLQVKQNVIRYSSDNNELLLLNWHKYNWTTSEKFRKPLLSQINAIKTQEYKDYLMSCFNGIDRVSVPNGYPMDTTVSVSVTDTVSDSVIKEIPYTEIVTYLNSKTGKAFSDGTKETRRYIKARFAEGRTLEDFKKVIDNMTSKWSADPKMQDYLRPQTLFGTKFEAYLNSSPQKVVEGKNRFNNFQQRNYDFEELERKLTGRAP